MIIGLIAIFITSIISIRILSLFASGIITLGRIIDLFYEIYMLRGCAVRLSQTALVSTSLMGVFVHVLKLFLKYAAGDG